MIILSIDVGGTRSKYGLVAPDTGTLLTLDSGPTVTRGLVPFIAGVDAALEILRRRAAVRRETRFVVTAFSGYGVVRD